MGGLILTWARCQHDERHAPINNTHVHALSWWEHPGENNLLTRRLSCSLSLCDCADKCSASPAGSASSPPQITRASLLPITSCLKAVIISAACKMYLIAISLLVSGYLSIGWAQMRWDEKVGRGGAGFGRFILTNHQWTAPELFSSGLILLSVAF